MSWGLFGIHMQPEYHLNSFNHALIRDAFPLERIASGKDKQTSGSLVLLNLVKIISEQQSISLFVHSETMSCLVSLRIISLASLKSRKHANLFL